jgi:hypothetical protein
MKQVFVLAHDQARQRALDAVGMAPAGYSVTLAEPRRSSAENNLLHALIDEISRKLEWAGKKRDPETWKRLLVAAWCRVHGESVEVLPALDGHGVDIVPARTSKLTRKECADLIEFIYAWGADQGIEWTEFEGATNA